MKVSKNKPKRLGVLLKGLHSILEALSLEYKDLADRLGMAPNHLSRLAKLKQGTSQATVEALCKELCCKEADLLFEQPEFRLAQIVADSDEKKARNSRTLAKELTKKAGAA